MRRDLRSWAISVVAGLLVGAAGGFLALQAIRAATGAETVVTVPEQSPAGSTDSRLPGPGEDLLEVVPAEQLDAEIRRVVNQALSQGRRTAIVNATEKVRASVVTVFVTQRGTSSLFDIVFNAPRSQEGLGSGVIVAEDGYILTNEHVVGGQGVTSIKVRLADGGEHDADLVDSDASRDLAVIKIDPPRGMSVSELGSSEDLLIGEWVIALGSPYGFALRDPQPSVSVGVVSAVGRSFITESEGELRYFPSTIQTDAAINPGNSGGPLVNSLGEIIGINSFILSQSGGSVGIGFAIPIDHAKRAMDQIREYGYMRRPWVGLESYRRNMYTLVRQGVYESPGAVVVDVAPRSPADEAGLERGDLIVRVDGERIEDPADLDTALIRAEIGDTLEIEYFPFRSRRTETVEITVVEEPRGR
ncbi:MAG: trypsin-like peptidase domain-containing protein [bacterium]